MLPWGDGADMRTAALINATAAHAVEVDDIYSPGLYHPGVAVIGAALAVADAERAKVVGFGGKYLIHPDHLEPLHRVFSPSEEEVAAARKLLAAWEEAQGRGLGVVKFDGRMVDGPIAERARHVIEQAQAIGSP